MEKTQLSELGRTQQELYFCKKGHPFTDIVPVKASEHFGKHWSEEIKKLGMDSMEIFNNAEKAQLEPIELTLAALRSEQKPAASLKSGYELNVEVLHGNPDYKGMHKVLGVKENDIILNTVYKETADGIYKNNTKIELLNAKLIDFKSMKEEPAPKIETGKAKPDFADQVLSSIKEKSKGNNAKTIKKVALITGGILVTGLAIYLIVKAVKKKTPPADQQKQNNIPPDQKI